MRAWASCGRAIHPCAAAAEAASQAMQQIPLPMLPELRPSFDSFIVGSNHAALAHLQHLAMPTAPLYLWGAPGSGKTHLLRALVDHVHGAGARAGCFAPGDALPWRLDPGWALVVIDDCHALDDARQHAVFSLFVDALSHGVQLAAAGRLPPVDLPLRDDVRTRLGWGHVFALQCLTEAETRAALRRDADRRGILLSDEVLDFLLTRFPRDLKALMELLDGLDEYAWARARAVTVPLLKQMIAEHEFGAPVHR